MMTEEEIMKLTGRELIAAMGGRPKGSQKKDEGIEFSDYYKVIRPTINNRLCYARVPIRRRTPEEILTHRPITDADDLECRIRLIVDWYRDMMSEHNIVIDFGFQALTDEEMDAMLAEETDESISQTIFEVER